MYNSNLNNRSRRTDPRNELYLTSAAIAVKLNAKIIIIENVPSVNASKQEVVERTKLLLEHNGYTILNKKNTLMAANLLVAQTRGRHFLIAIKSKRKKLKHMAMDWRIQDLNYLLILLKLDYQ